MKKYILFVWIILLIGFLFTDRQLFYYGKNRLPIHSPLPFGVIPQSEYDKFSLYTQDGFSLVYSGGELTLIDSKVKNIIGYGYDSNMFVVLIETYNKKEVYIRIVKKTNPRFEGELSFSYLPKIAKYKLDNLTWIYIDNKDYIFSLILAELIFFYTLLLLTGVVTFRITFLNLKNRLLPLSFFLNVLNILIAFFSTWYIWGRQDGYIVFLIIFVPIILSMYYFEIVLLGLFFWVRSLFTRKKALVEKLKLTKRL